MRMERNGQALAELKSRHFKMKEFFIKDRVWNCDIMFVHCPTEHMIADFFTKPLQGKLSFRFRDVIMGTKYHMSLTETTEDISQEKMTSAHSENIPFREYPIVLTTTILAVLIGPPDVLLLSDIK